MLETDTGMVRVTPGATIDFEGTATTYTLVVRATDNPNGTPQLSVRHPLISDLSALY